MPLISSSRDLSYLFPLICTFPTIELILINGAAPLVWEEHETESTKFRVPEGNSLSRKFVFQERFLRAREMMLLWLFCIFWTSFNMISWRSKFRKHLHSSQRSTNCTFFGPWKTSSEKHDFRLELLLPDIRELLFAIFLFSLFPLVLWTSIKNVIKSLGRYLKIRT